MVDNHWIAVKVSGVIIALQHHCGVQSRAVNCYIDQRGNWECPNCMTTYGASVELSLGDQYEIERIAQEEE